MPLTRNPTLANGMGALRAGADVLSTVPVARSHAVVGLPVFPRHLAAQTAARARCVGSRAAEACTVEGAAACSRTPAAGSACVEGAVQPYAGCLLYTSPSPRD
eukprot:15034374-Alexandrium_andersonii.AAC.1